jgi:hypothetical protein
MGRIIKKRDATEGHLSYKAVQPVNVDWISPHEVSFCSGPRGYLWFKGGSREGVGWLHGRATLRALAHAILEAYPDEPKKGRK